MSNKLIVELDGSHHAEQQAADLKRDTFLPERGYQILHYWNNQVFDDSYAVLEDIYNHLSPPPHQRSPDGLVSATPPQKRGE